MSTGRYSFSALLGSLASRRRARAVPSGVLGVRDFRLLWLGEGISLLGTHFQVVALSWLALNMTGSGLALGLILMFAAIPRTIFVLLGGALADQLTPRFMMLGANVIRALCVATLTALVAFDAVQLWHLYVLAAIFGLMGAFFQPAYLSMVPSLVAKEHIAAANALLFATSQLSGALGPVLAGYIIQWAGIVTAFGLDAATYLFAAAAVASMQARGSNGGPERTSPRRVIRDIGIVLRWIRHDPIMRPLLVTVAVVNLLLAGPLSVGLPVLAHTRFASDPAALGTLLSSLGTGALLGTLLGGRLRSLRRRGLIVLGILVCVGSMLASIGVAPNLILASLATATVGLLLGFVVVMFFSWLQQNTGQEMMGRMMSVVVFAGALLIPISNVAGGALADRNPSMFFLLAGSLIVVTGLVTALNRPLREID